VGKTGYQVLGFAVWKGGKWYLRRRYGDTPRRLALAVLLGMVLAALLMGGRRWSDDS
jgi:hypothetical protein